MSTADARSDAADPVRVVVAGGTDGLGATIATRFARQGDVVAVCGRRESTATAFEDRCRVDGLPVTSSVVDVTDRAALTQWLDSTVDELGGIDVFVANAGSSAAGDDWRGSFDAALHYVVEACERLAEPLTESRGSVVMLGSIAALTTDAGPENAAYGAAKAALTHYASTLAEQWGPQGVRVNVVVPGPVVVPGGHWDSEVAASTDIARSLQQRAPLRRFVTAAEVADAVAFLASPSASGITGASLRVDAGLATTATN